MRFLVYLLNFVVGALWFGALFSSLRDSEKYIAGRGPLPAGDFAEHMLLIAAFGMVAIVTSFYVLLSDRERAK